MNETTLSAPDRTDGGDEQLVSSYLIELAGDLYALPQAGEITLSWVQRPQEPTYLPTLPSWCLGLVNARNTPVLLIDPCVLLDLPTRDTIDVGEHARHVFVERGGDTIGLLVERTHRFRLLPAQSMPPDGELIAGMVRVDDQIIRVLNLEALWRNILHELGAQSGREAVA